MVNRYSAASADGGETFLPAVRLSSAPTDKGATWKHVVGAEAYSTQVSFESGASDHGEYLGLATATDGTFHPFWMNGRTGSDQIWTATVRVEHRSKRQLWTYSGLGIETREKRRKRTE